MNTIVISKKMIVGLVIASLVASVVAIAPFPFQTAQAAKKAVNLSCMQTAVDTREDAVAAAFKGFDTDVQTALTARKTALHDAWGMTDKVARNAAVKTAWTTWKTSQKAAHTKLKTARKAAWATFKTTAKTSCKETLPKEEVLGADAAGTIAL